MVPEQFWIASGNSHKVQELRYLATRTFPSWPETVSREPKGAEENAASFIGNAEIKAFALAAELLSDGQRNFAVLADDSGLCIDVLGGAPGIISGRYARESETNIQKVLRVLGSVTMNKIERGGKYHCALVLVRVVDGRITSQFHGEGIREGFIAIRPRGENGYAYDSIFTDCESGLTYGEVSPKAKHSDSHRARAFQALKSSVHESPV